MYLLNKRELNIIEDFRKGFNLYKNNFKLLLYVSLLNFLAVFAYETYGYLISYFNFKNIFIFSALMFVAYIYINSLLTITLVKIIYNICNEKSSSFKQEFNSSKLRFWNYFWTRFKFVIIIAIPSLIEFSIFSSANIISTKCILMIMFAFPLGYLVSTYGFAPTLSCLEEFGDKEYLQSSRNLVKGHLIELVALFFLTEFLVWGPKYYLVLSGNKNITINYLVNIVNQGFFLILNPLIITVYIIVIKNLRKNHISISIRNNVSN